jgi:hypothetical protein
MGFFVFTSMWSAADSAMMHQLAVEAKDGNATVGALCGLARSASAGQAAQFGE